jgi:hypothetical protein
MRTVLLAVALVAAACAGAPAAPAGGSAGAGPADPAQLYRAKCSGCHRPYDPASRSRAQWAAVFSRMARRAHLTAEEADVLGGWLDASAADAPPGGAR